MVVFDDVARRQVAAAVFLGIQAVKVHQWFASTEIIWLWILLDIAFFVTLHFMRIPLLDFSLPITLLLVVSFVVVNLIASQSSIQDGLHIPGTAMSIGGHVPEHIPEDGNGTHIVGVHTVVVKPPIVGSLNPNSTSFCLSDTTTTVSVPLLIRGSWLAEYLVEYERTPYGAKVSDRHNLTVTSVPVSKSIAETPIPKSQLTKSQLFLNKPGRYRLLRVWELKKGVPHTLGSVIHGETDVVGCPEAKWIFTDTSRKRDICVDELYRLEAELNGAPPFQLRYLQRIARTDSLMTTTVDIASPDTSTGDEQIALDADVAPQKVRHSIELRVDVTAPYFFRILSVSDRFENLVFYEDSIESVPDVKGMVIHASTQGDHQLVEVHPRPTARFTETDAFKLLMQNADGKPIASGSELPFVLDGSAPFTITYRKDNESPLIKSDIRTSLSHMPVSTSGVYELLSVKDQYCAGTLLLPSQREVVGVYPPRITIAAEPLMERCVGEVGASVNLTFAGEPPFRLDYQEIRSDTGTRTNHYIDSPKSRANLPLRPAVAGRWKYEWISISDAYYKDVKISAPPFSQVVHPQSEARFNIGDKLLRCIGDHVKLRVDLQGSGPWTLTYDTIADGASLGRTRLNVATSPAFIVTPPFNSSGEVKIDLIEITDANGCNFPLSVPQASVSVLTQRPAASFICPKPVEILENQIANLHLSLSGHPPYKIKVRHVETGQTFDTDKSPLPVRLAGVYELESLTDAYCYGKLKSPMKCEVTITPRPSLILDHNQCANYKEGICCTPEICEGDTSIVHVDIKGKPPFTLDLTQETEDASKRSSVESKHIDTDKRAAIPLSSLPGRHTYHITGVRDGNYPIDVPKRNEIQLVHKVKARPRATLGHAPVRIFRCASDGPSGLDSPDALNDSEALLTIDLSGEPPFVLSLRVKQDGFAHTQIRVDNITESTYGLPLTRMAESAGSLTISLLRVSDATGCPRDYDPGLVEHQKTIQVTDVARITSLSPASACVGETLLFSLQGVPPFFIKYRLGNKTLTEQESQPVFSVSATQSGVVTVDEVCNRAEGLGQVERCCPVSLSHTVHEIPSVRVDGGHATIDDIQEGGTSLITFDFMGTPPFNMTYKRSTPGQPDETFRVADIKSRHYEVETSQEGTYRVVSIADKYCAYPRKS
ncbi:hypothetical protein SmJEL517_g03361 [Synchytrium microbalum]|uniref:Nucleoporin Pom152 n=1 Tax=Synchytrium microbalum TaxID=1806994 RepID=A0A507C8U7_9FUNG|nr:uncharacterized protein SmJEL517_g03361 [Synchytrium microbalum]TPX33925.1 hypothetical protein SmJEL517_g03361 [Synchytrium microbalum]